MAIENATTFEEQWLICRTGRRIMALPLASVIETMRPLPVETIAQAPALVRGLSIVRGVPIPIVVAARLFGEQETTGQNRWITIRVGARVIAFEVDHVIGLQRIPKSAGYALPLLMREADADVISAVGALDSELVVFLESTRIMPDAVLDALALESAPQ